MERIRPGEELYDYLIRVEANPRRTSKGWSVRCLHPDHEDKNNSAIVFDDSWHACMGGCKRFSLYGPGYQGAPAKETYEPKVIRGTVDYFDYWLSLEPLDEGIKGIPARHLNSLGWRKIESNNQLGTKGGIFIPYFTVGRDKILFYQVRHSEGSRRFTFTPGVTPIANGYESIPEMGKFLPFTEGASDRAVLELAGIPTVALPSASSGALLKGLASHAKANSMVAVACTDNDIAGDRLLSALDGVSTYIDLRPPKQYKDFGDMYEDKGIQAVRQHLRMLLPKKQTPSNYINYMSENEVKDNHKNIWEIMYN